MSGLPFRKALLCPRAILKLVDFPLTRPILGTMTAVHLMVARRIVPLSGQPVHLHALPAIVGTPHVLLLLPAEVAPLLMADMLFEGEPMIASAADLHGVALEVQS